MFYSSLAIMASSSAPPVLPFDTSSRFFAWVHEHSASPLCVDPACTYYNGSRAVDVMGQRRHDKGVMTYDGPAYYQDALWLCEGSATNSTPVQYVYTNSSSPPCHVAPPKMGFCNDPAPELTVPAGATYVGLETGVNGLDAHHWSFYFPLYQSTADAWTAAAADLDNALVRFTGARVTTDYTSIAVSNLTDAHFAPPPQCA